MSYFAKVDFFGKVLKVIVSDQDFADLQPGMWIPCDIDGVSPKNYPGVGHTYDRDLNAYIAPKPFPSWSLNSNTCQWDPPVERPSPNMVDDKLYVWNEDGQTWDLL